MTAVDPKDEGRHQPDGQQLWNESYYMDFTTADGTLGGYIRIGLYPGLGVAWYWACVVGEGRPLVTVIEHEAPLPSGPRSLELRSEGLWCDHTVEEPYEHFTLGLEAFGVAVDDPAEVYRAGGMRGDRAALGFDLEWETDGGVYPYPGVTRYEVPCRVHGEVLVGSERIEFDGHGQRDHSWGTRDWWTFGWVWSAGRLDDGTRFHGSDIRIPNLDLSFGYVVPPDDGLQPASGLDATEELGLEGFPTSARMQLDSLAMSVTPLHFSPVRLDAPDGRVSRFPRALCRFVEDDGRTGYGWTEWNQPQSPPA